MAGAGLTRHIQSPDAESFPGSHFPITEFHSSHLTQIVIFQEDSRHKHLQDLLCGSGHSRRCEMQLFYSVLTSAATFPWYHLSKASSFWLTFPGKGLKEQTRKVMRKEQMRPRQSLHGSYSPFKSGRVRQQLGWTCTPGKVQGTPLSHLVLSSDLLRNLLLLQPCLLARPDGVKRIQQ